MNQKERSNQILSVYNLLLWLLNETDCKIENGIAYYYEAERVTYTCTEAESKILESLRTEIFNEIKTPLKIKKKKRHKKIDLLK